MSADAKGQILYLGSLTSVFNTLQDELIKMTVSKINCIWGFLVETIF